ncbi:unnamed protein product, partial [Rotaria socialis]
MGVLYNKLPDILNIIEETLPTTITNLNDTAIRERLSKQYVRIIQKAKYDLMSVLSAAAQFNKDEHRETYDKEMIQLWDNQRQLPNDERLTENLLTILDQRQQNIIKCYVPCTLNHNASSPPGRYLLLPCYPNSNDETSIDLLLTNIPIYQLNQQELKQRSIDGFHQSTSVKPINDHERRLFTLSLLWNVNKEILE